MSSGATWRHLEFAAFNRPLSEREPNKEEAEHGGWRNGQVQVRQSAEGALGKGRGLQKGSAVQGGGVDDDNDERGENAQWWCRYWLTKPRSKMQHEMRARPAEAMAQPWV